jgi:mRNA interferase MazF
MEQARVVKRGQIYLTDFDHSRGSEIRKVRPAVILQNDIANKHSDTTIVAAIRSKVGQQSYPNQVKIAAGEGGLKLDSIIQLNQIRTVDKSRLGPLLGSAKPQTMLEVDQALAISLGLVDLED